MSFRRAVSAGGVVYRVGENGIEVVLCGMKQPPTWRLPKGKPKAGERLEQTALREVAEETGLKVKLEAKIDKISYWFFQDKTRYFKTVHFFLMSVVGGDISGHDPEFDEVSWFPLKEAFKKLSFKTEVTILEKAANLIPNKEGRTLGPAT